MTKTFGPKISFKVVAISAIFVLLFSSIRRKIFLWLLFSTFLAGCLLYLAFSIKPVKHKHITDTKRFKFLTKSNWDNEVAALTVSRALLDAPAIPESFLISEFLDDMFQLIVREFVDLWFKKISSSHLFQDSIRLELKHVVTTLNERLANVNFANLLVLRIIPLITDHYSHFVSASKTHDKSKSIESKLLMAQTFGRARLHEGVSLSLPGPNRREKEKMYLRRKVGAVLPNLLSSQENTNATVLLLITELLACTVLANVFEVLTEGDFFNQMIVKLIGANLQHRNQVKRLRAALEEHTAQSNLRDRPLTLPDKLTQEKASMWMKYVDSNESREEMDHLQRAIQEKQALLARSTGDFNTEIKLLSALSDRVAQKLHTSLPSSVTIESILNQSKSAAVFREYLKKEKHESEIDLWQAIDRIKAPLEDSDATDVPLLLEFSNKADILRIYSTYFNDPSIPISDDIRASVSSYVKCSDDEASAVKYHQARRSLFVLQDQIAEHMKNHHFRGFQRSNRYGDLDFGKQNQRMRRVASLSFGNSNIPNYPDDMDDSAISSDVVSAVATAFEKIMKSSDGEADSASQFANANRLPSRTLFDSGSESRQIPLGDISSLFEDVEREEVDSSNRMSALFDDASEDESGSESAHSDSLLLSTELPTSKMADLGILLAAPGDLSLSEKIDTLDKNIQNLTEQDDILASLLRKAELTNNVPELRVLRKSKVSVEREINAKELQKQQYIVQENENSLYGKSKVQIQSCVFGNDDPTSYVLYIIEVQKFSSDDPNEVIAGWMVARRFSQFFKLHEYLKRRCPQVINIKFPKKSVPMLKFQKVQQVELRKPMLEKYLQSILKIPEVCSDPAFRSFLSSDDFLLGKAGAKHSQSFDAFFNRVYTKMSLRVPLAPAIRPRSEHEKEEILANIQEMERELKQFDEIGKDKAKVPFVKPISDLLMTIFHLNNSQSWLRGRALLVILQQVLGSAIERTITRLVDANLRLEEKILSILGLLRQILFPNGKFRESPELRTKLEQSTTRDEANVILRVFMNETCAKVFGFKNTNQASAHLFEMFQNDFLNKLLFFEILDELLLAICPEGEDKN